MAGRNMAEKLLCQSEDEIDNREQNDAHAWRDVDTGDETSEEEDTDVDSSDSDDTEDEDNSDETRRFVRLLSRLQTVRVVLASGEVQNVTMPGHIKVTTVEIGEEEKGRRERELERRREEARSMELVATGAEKRKFGDRMSLDEAKREDFEDPEDYVDFLNAKLKNVNIKLCR